MVATQPWHTTLLECPENWLVTNHAANEARAMDTSVFPWPFRSPRNPALTFTTLVFAGVTACWTYAGAAQRLLGGAAVAAQDMDTARPRVSPPPDGLRVAETLLVYQRASGGWPKNYRRDRQLTDSQRREVASQTSKNDATIDNGATVTEIRLLAEAFAASKDDRYKDSALRGIQYLLSAQYANGGWPQRFPEPRGYARFITFNDHAMIGVMTLLDDVSRGREPFAFAPSQLREQCAQAVLRGVDCILKCQIRVAGRLTAWCAQHDHETLAPEKARSYELPSLSGAESVGIVRFLMRIEEPSPEIVASIEGAADWLEKAKLSGIRVETIRDATQPEGIDKVVVRDAAAPPMWARFYDISTNQPIFCSRDGIPRQSLADISHERRTSYSWLGYYATSLLEDDLPAWRLRIRQAASK